MRVAGPLLLAALAGLATAGRFDALTDCRSCVAAGFGWSATKQSCGGFKNKDCGAAEPPPPPKRKRKLSAAEEVAEGAKLWQQTKAASQHAKASHYEKAAAAVGAEAYPSAAGGLAAAAASGPGRYDDAGAGAGRWAGLRAVWAAANANHTECKGFACYKPTLEADLAPWKKTGITEDIFEKTRTYNIDAGRMNHYQIIGGRLYRSQRCPSRSGRLSFHPRCEGIEHTLLELLAEDRKGKGRGKKPRIPDVEFVLNVNDKPQMAHASSPGVCLGADDKKKLCTLEPLPLFSFSKPQGIDSVKSVRRGSPAADFDAHPG